MSGAQDTSPNGGGVSNRVADLLSQNGEYILVGIFTVEYLTRVPGLFLPCT